MGATNHPSRGPHPRLVLGVALFTVLPVIATAGMSDERSLVALLIPAPLFVLLGIDWLRSREAWMRFLRMRSEARWFDVILLGGGVWPRSEEHFAPERIFGSAMSIIVGCGLATIAIVELVDWL